MENEVWKDVAIEGLGEMGTLMSKMMVNGLR